LISRGVSNIDKLWVNIQRVESATSSGVQFFPTNFTSEAGIRAYARQLWRYDDAQIDDILAAYPIDQFASFDLQMEAM
jgi:hypothetical protein